MAAVEILRAWWRVRYPVYAVGILVGLVMMWLPVKTGNDNDAWEDRLRADGVPVQAVIDELIHKGRKSDTMHLRYEFGGAERRAEVGCWEVCLPAGTPVRIWVDPEDPGDFVTDFGTLSGHRGRVQGVIGAAGLILAGSMVLVGFTRLDRRRRDRRQRDRQRQQRDQRRQEIGPARVGTKRKPSRRRTTK
ncbi:DUF3592 domain-containing protein [Micromonospora sp. WMMD812]|uniref:DUF3592 domain-containing protein n=1 Tax=Micromonospora sp. WMMD812 TaxID=3015152 RepID=UPI00248BA447|nr:DUF3592 domain-containing protein [Micromonospora sp. WMMD812]WBB65207.1 DUF3592 domain-containing protein [Micromonospora sp. WMMD812]